MLIRVLLVAVCAIAAVPAYAEVVIVRPGAAMPGLQLSPGYPPGLEPGRAAPRAPVDAMAVRFSWDAYDSVIIVGDGTGVARPAWVLTYDRERQFLVGYRASAFRADDGRIHVDARNAIDNGPMADNWIPDSFALQDDGKVYSLDDQGHGNEGVITARAEPDNPDYATLMRLAQALISGAY